MRPSTLRLLQLLVNLQEKFHLIKSGIPIVCEAFDDLLVQFATDLEDSFANNPELSAAVKLNAKKLIATGYTSDVNSSYKINELLVKNCELVQPKGIVIAKSFETDCSLPASEKVVENDVTGQIVPFKLSLQQILSNKECLSFVDYPNIPSKDGVLRCIKDGLIWKDHPVIKKFPNALLIQLYDDDLEIVNPLGSRVKSHKLTNIYWTLLNVPEFLRSSLKCINLLACVKSKYVKIYGLQPILEDFLDCMKSLESDQGLHLTINGASRVFHGALISVNGDGLAQNSVGGFKESFAFALKCCRTCNFEKKEMAEVFIETNFRDWDTHKSIVASLKNPSLTKKEKTSISRDSGVKGDTTFSVLENFNPTKCFAHDIMHDLLEGVADMEIRSLLSHLILSSEDHSFTLELLNQKIKTFRYPLELKSSKPSFIEKSHLENSLRESASQMLCIIFSFPFILSPFVNDASQDHYNNFILLVQITSRLLSYEIDTKSLPMLAFMIDAHHTRFKELYPSVNLTPKFHFLTHSISTIRNFGPIRNSWCMRFEGMNAWFSKSAQATKNFICIEKTLAAKFQVKRCAEMGFGNTDHMFLGSHTFKPELSNNIRISDYKLGYNVAQEMNLGPNVSPNTVLHGAKNVYLKNFHLNVDSVVMVEYQKELCKPKFGKIKAIFVENQSCVLVLRALTTLKYCEQKFAFHVEDTEFYQCLNSKKLQTLQPFPLVRDHDSLQYVIPMFYDLCLFDG